jgi:hypothetical protein
VKWCAPISAVAQLAALDIFHLFKFFVKPAGIIATLQKLANGFVFLASPALIC